MVSGSATTAIETGIPATSIVEVAITPLSTRCNSRLSAFIRLSGRSRSACAALLVSSVSVNVTVTGCGFPVCCALSAACCKTTAFWSKDFTAAGEIATGVRLRTRVGRWRAAKYMAVPTASAKQSAANRMRFMVRIMFGRFGLREQSGFGSAGSGCLLSGAYSAHRVLLLLPVQANVPSSRHRLRCPHR